MDKWMSRKVGDTQTLSDICIPASHDAGMYMQTDNHGNIKSSGAGRIITHENNILKQLQDGYRMFDLRIYPNKMGQLHCGHFIELTGKGKTDILGGFGDRLQRVLNQVNEFLSLTDSANETVILKFSHIKAENTGAVFHMVTDSLKNRLYAANGTQTIGNLPFSALRGKVLAIFSNEFEDDLLASKATAINFTNLKGDDSWAAAVALAEKRNKLILRGKYSNKRTYKDMLKKQQKLLKAWYVGGGLANKYPGELMQLYWTATWHVGSPLHKMNIKNNTKPLWTVNARNELKSLIGNFRPNIVITDFADQRKAIVIINSAYWA